MSVDKLFGLYGVDVVAEDTPTSDQFINGVTDMKMNPGFEEILMGSDGQVNPTFAAASKIAPVINFTTLAIAKSLNKIKLCGTPILGGTGVVCFFQQLDDLAKRLGALKHLKMSVLKGILVPRTLTAPSDSDATITYDVICLFDGTNDPIIVAKNQTIPVDTLGVDEVFRAGPVFVNGTQIKGIKNIEIDFGLNVVTEGSDGEVFLRFGAVMDQKPKITFTTKDADQVNDISINGLAQTSTDSHFYLRKVAKNGTRVPDGTAEHIQFSVDDGMLKINDSGQPSEASNDTIIEVLPTSDGVNEIIAINTAIAITS